MRKYYKLKNNKLIDKLSINECLKDMDEEEIVNYSETILKLFADKLTYGQGLAILNLVSDYLKYKMGGE